MKTLFLRTVRCAAWATVMLFAVMTSYAADSNWEQVLAERLPAYGHRNWIVVADSAYPAQSRDGIETIVAGGDQVRVLQRVLQVLSHATHVTPIVYTDQELKYLNEDDAPGIDVYRKDLETLLEGRPMNVLPHEQLIKELDQVSQTFRVLIIKTNMTLPYTSVFLRLDCAYWGPDAEKRLRAKMKH